MPALPWLAPGFAVGSPEIAAAIPVDDIFPSVVEAPTIR
jgi:hypothetical protein